MWICLIMTGYASWMQTNIFLKNQRIHIEEVFGQGESHIYDVDIVSDSCFLHPHSNVSDHEGYFDYICHVGGVEILLAGSADGHAGEVGGQPGQHGAVPARS
jgi:hypothetical protein